jgi:putative acetyltransferase
MTTSTIRPARADDIDDLVDVRIAVAGEGRWIGRELPIDAAQEAELLARSIAAPTNTLVVAEADGRVAGYALVHDAGHGHGEVAMAIVDGHRGAGLGTALLDAALAGARATGAFHKIVLQVWPHNAAGIALYRRAGFVVEGYRHRHWRRANGELWDAIEMGLLLEP